MFGGVFDDAFVTSSNTFFDQVRKKRFELVSSALVVDELAGAPEQVRAFFMSLADCMRIKDISREGVMLRDMYLKAGIVGPASLADAQHVALATVLNCQLEL